MMHVEPVLDEQGDVVDHHTFCSASCHRLWCYKLDKPYDGWAGTSCETDSRTYCEQCGIYVGGGTGEEEPCSCLSQNVVVNRIPEPYNIYCEHGNVLQAGLLEERFLS